MMTLPFRTPPHEVRHVRAVWDVAGLEWLAVVGKRFWPDRVARAALATDPALRRAVLDYLAEVPPDCFSRAALELVRDARSWGDELVEPDRVEITPWW